MKIGLLIHIVFFSGILSCYGNEFILSEEGMHYTVPWVFTVEVGVEKRTADAVGGFEKVKEIVNNQFMRINDKFNRPQVFDNHFHFKVSSFFVFEGPSSHHCFSTHPCCDVRMVLNGYCDKDDAAGGWYSGDIKCIHHRWDMDHKGGPFGESATDGIVHEFGHVRGAIDIYALKVDKEKNPVNHTSFEGAKGIMNGCYGEDEWDLHSVNMINMSEDFIDPPDLRDLFPEKIGIKLLNKDGAPLPRCTIRLFPVLWYSYTVQENAIVEGFSGDNGEFFFEENPFGITSGDKYPWNIQYCNFLVEIVNKEEITYGWMPINEVQNAFFNQKDYVLVIRF